MYLSKTSLLEAKFLCQEFSAAYTVINMNVRAFRHAVSFTLHWRRGYLESIGFSHFYLTSLVLYITATV